jgi:hypothetical protein
MSNLNDLATEVMETVKCYLRQGMPSAVLIYEPNPLDPSTPVNMPLKVVGWSVGSANVTYNLPGYDQIQPDDDEHFIVTNGLTDHVLRRSRVDLILVEDRLQDENIVHEMIEDLKDSLRYIVDGD